MNLSVYLSFVAGAGLLAIIPGPGILFVLAQTSKGGKSAGLSASLGTAVGGMFHVLAGAAGFSALVYSSSIAFEGVKVLGAFYLFYLGLKALRDNRDFSIDSLRAVPLQTESLKQGIVTEFLNPKTALFFLALIPQFINSRQGIAGQFMILGTTSVILNTSMDILVVFTSDALIAHLRKSNQATRYFKTISATGYFTLGVLALRTQRESN